MARERRRGRKNGRRHQTIMNLETYAASSG